MNCSLCGKRTTTAVNDDCSDCELPRAFICYSCWDSGRKGQRKCLECSAALPSDRKDFTDKDKVEVTCSLGRQKPKDQTHPPATDSRTPKPWTENGILRLYNQFPRCYADIPAMTADLPRIAKMGFNAVWINPIQKVGQRAKLAGEKNQKHKDGTDAQYGSLYAMADRDQIDPAFLGGLSQAEAGEAMKEYCAKAKALGLIPIFDLVAKHVAVDADLIEKRPHWFSRYRNGVQKGRLEVRGVDDYGVRVKSDPWDDVANFNYSYIDEIMEFWRPFIGRYMRDWGFGGARVDAAGMFSREAHERLFEMIKEFNSEAIIFAEFLPKGEEKRRNDIELLKGTGITHVTNDARWVPMMYGPNKSTSHYNGYELWAPNADNWYTHVMGEKQQVVHMEDPPPIPGGTVGFVSSHDVEPWPLVLKDEAHFEKAMREKISVVAFTSDAGWYLLSGDEFGIQEKVSVFEGDKRMSEEALPHHRLNPCEASHDFSRFIAAVNEVLAHMPPVEFQSWPERLFLERKQDDVAAVVRHTGEGLGGPTRLILVNLNPDQPVEVTWSDIEEIWNEGSKTKMEIKPDHVHLVEVEMVSGA